MKAQHLLALTLATLLSSPAWADDPFQLHQPHAAPNIQLQSQAVQVHTLPDGRYHAEINYQDQTNDTRKFTFEGTQEEIRQQLAQANLPEDRKQAVLQALEMRPDALFGNAFGNGFPLGNSLFGGKDPFDHPFFKQDPFDDPFFKNSPLNDEFVQRFFQGFPAFGGIPNVQPNWQPAPPVITPPAPVKPPPPETGNRVWL
jgi:hypothetical protein